MFRVMGHSQPEDVSVSVPERRKGSRADLDRSNSCKVVYGTRTRPRLRGPLFLGDPALAVVEEAWAMLDERVKSKTKG